MVHQLTQPFTFEGKELAIQKEIRRNYDEYFARAAVTRAWFPHRLDARAELRRYSHRAGEVDAKVKEMLLGFLAVESFVDDYVYAGIQGAGDNVTIRESTYQWGIEERRHGQTFRMCLIDGGFLTQAEVDAFLAECSQDTWIFERQTGFAATAYNASAYAITQERQTRHNYTSFRKYLRAEYARTGNPLLLAIDDAVGYVERDEGAHEGNFRAILRIYLRYRPDLAIEAMNRAFDHYTMPIVKIPNKQEFAEAIVAAGVFSLIGWGREVLKPSLKGMGLENRKALRAAEKAVQELPENALVVLPNKPVVEIPLGAEVHQLIPNGSFQLLAS